MNSYELLMIICQVATILIAFLTFIVLLIEKIAKK